MSKNNQPAQNAVEGAPVLAVRKDSATALADSDGDFSFLQVDATGALRTSGGGGGGGGIAQVDKSSFVEGTTSFTPVGGVFNETISSDPIEDQAACARITAKRAVHVNLRDSSGNEFIWNSTDGLLVNLGANNDVSVTNGAGVGAVNIQDGGNSITVDGSVSISGTVDTELPSASALADNTANPTVPGVGSFGMIWDGVTWDRSPGTSVDGTLVNLGANNDVAVTSVIPGTGATNLGKAEDAAHTTGDTGVFMLGVRNTSNTTSTSADRDYAPISTDLWDAPISGVRRQSTILTAINTTYNTTSTETNTSAAVDCSMFRKGSFCATVTETGAATDITFTLQFSNDGGTTWFDYRVGPWVRYRFDDATIAAHGSGQLKICELFECATPTVRMSVTATGLTSGVDEFVVANASFELVN